MLEPKVIFEDDALLVLNKPAGLVVHEGHGQTDPTVVDWLTQRFPKSSLKQEHYGLLHRLDKDTSGVLLVAKQPDTFEYLKRLFKRHAVHKEYLVLVHGKLMPRAGLINVPIARDLIRRTRFEPAASGRAAETRYEVVAHYSGFTYLKAYPTTGRTHQIRVHFASIGHPVAGDKTYGRTDALPRQFLHAHGLNFADWNGKTRHFISPLAPDLKQFLGHLSR
ncbi:MAG: RluA family pseudouridine synthase [bacterium]